MSALGRVVRSGVGRRRVQTVVIMLVTTMAVTASVLGGSLLVASSAPFDNAFARQNGAHLTAYFDATKTTSAQLAATADADGVTAASGPFRTASITPTIDSTTTCSSTECTQSLPSLTVAGRADPDGAVDKIGLVDGRWATSPDEIVMSADSDVLVRIGETLRLRDAPGKPTLTVVGLARSVSRTADAWVVPSAVRSLTAPDAEVGYQMLYRFADADTADDIADGRAAVTTTVPDGALTGSQSWLATKKEATGETAVFVPFLIAFGVLGVVMSVLIVGNVIAGAVSAGTRRIGVLKALGFTPAQVVRAYTSQALIPAAVGAAIGVVAGNLLALPILAEAESAYRTTGLTVAWWVSVVVVAGVLGVVAATALASALRAGRLRTVDALAVGRSSSQGRGLRVARFAARLPLPRSIGLGLARPFARPARAGAMVAAVVFGVTAVTFTVGLKSSLSEVLDAMDHEAADVTVLGAGAPEAGGQVVRPGPGTKSAKPADPDAIDAAIEDQPGTAAYYSTAMTEATVSGLSGSAEVFAFDGDASWGGYVMVSGRWIQHKGEAVVPTRFLTLTGAEVGDTVSLNVDGSTVNVRIVGEVFDSPGDAKRVYTTTSTLATADPDLQPTSHHIAVRDGVDVAAYVKALNNELKPLGATAVTGGTDDEVEVITTLNALAVMLTLMLVTVAALGVLNGVVLDTRERVQELGVHKALGMVPRQTISMVITSVVVPGLVGALLGVPLGLAVHGWVLPAMGATADLTLPDVVTDVYDIATVLGLGLGGVLIAVAGSLLPAGWAARTRTATALRTE